MPIVSHTWSPLLRLQLPVQFRHHLPRDPLIFDMRISVRETPSLLSDLLRSHFDFPSTLNKFLQIFRH
jgi:hypothetical protein